MPSISPTRVVSSTRGGDVSPRRAPAPTPAAKMAATPPLVFDDTDLSSRRYTTEFDLVYQPGGGQGVSAMSTAATKNAPNNSNVPPPRWASVNKDAKGEAASSARGSNITLQERRAPSREAKPRIQVPSPTREGESGELEGTYPPVRAVLAEHVLRPRTAGNSRPRARRNQDGGPRSRDESPAVGEGFRASALADLPPVGKQSPGIRKATPQGRHSRGEDDDAQFEVGGDFGPSRQAPGKRDSVVLSRSGSRSRVADVLRRSGVDSEGVLAVDDDEEDCPEGSPRVKRPNYSPPEADEGKRGGAADRNRRRSPSSILHNFSPTLDKPAPKSSSPSQPAAVARKEVEAGANNKDDDESHKHSDVVKPSPAAPAAPAGPQHHTKIEIGMMIRRWVVTSRIGAGSFGETFCAAEVPESFDLELYERLVEEATKRHHLTSTQTGGGLTTLGGSDSDLDDSVGGGGEASASINLGRPKTTAVSVKAGPAVASDDGDGLGPNCSAVSHDVDGSSQFDRPLLPLHDQAKAAISLEALAAMPDDMRPTSEVCIKVEQDSKNVLRLEVVSLKKSQPCANVVKYVGSGHIDAPLSVNYLVMERLGPNLAELRRQCPHQLFDIYTTLYTGISCLESLRGVHELGLVHRDVKPSNFVVGLGPERSRICYLIDFGLARRFKRSNGGMRPPRDNAGFRGTNRYASIQSHLHQELGRVDDLWSLLFMLVEFATGSLPWRKYKEKEAIGECKQQTVNADLVRTLPREFLPFLEHLQTLSYEGEPDYDYLIGLLKTSIVRRGYASDRLLDWEKYAGESLQLDDVADRTLPLPLRIQPLTTLPVNNSQNSRPGTDTAAKGGKGDDGSDAPAATPPPVEPIKKKNPHSWAARARSEAEENVGGADTPRPKEHPLTGAPTSVPASMRAILPPPTAQQQLTEEPPIVAEAGSSPEKKEDELKGSLSGISPACMLNVPGDGSMQGKIGEENQGSEGRETPTRPGAAVPPMSAEESSLKKGGVSSPTRDNPLQQPLISNTTSDANFNIDDSSPNRTPTATLGGANSVAPSNSNFAASLEKEDDRASKGSEDAPPVVGPNNRNRRNKKGEDDTVQGGCCDKGCTVQ